jgi:nicotinamidase-related amidase
MSEKAPYQRSAELLARSASRLVIVDVQEKLVPRIYEHQRMLARCRLLIEGAKILSVPVSVTEQYPAGLGKTVSQLAEVLPAPSEKLRFSCGEVLDWGCAAESSGGRHQVVVAGIETHVCVLQTVLDLIAAGYQVFVPADAVSSRSELDWKIALDRMSASGATIITVESALFEWCETSGAPEFKLISRLLKEQKQ